MIAAKKEANVPGTTVVDTDGDERRTDAAPLAAAG
jgi:hypothetical protein